ncbi:MAG: molybdenum cofactor guanylyltransferase [Phycisphaeraceae bacterium]|nr:molybdenum cofactor guanylyltransferase [Phycisphaeraceae bacterium]
MTHTHTNDRSGVPAYILAGGNSRRFGSDKARATLHGRPLILALSDQLVGLGFKITVVGKRDDQYADLGLDTIGDLKPDQGPVGGLRTALTHRQAGWILLCSCDMLGIDGSWITALFNQQRRVPDADAITARSKVWQPFPGLYHSRLLDCRALKESGSFQSLFARITVAPIESVGLLPIRQVNTLEALQRAHASDA